MTQPHLHRRRRHDEVRQAGHQGGRLPRLGTRGGRASACRRRHVPTRTSSRRSSATATATRPAASAPSTASASPACPVVNVNNNCSTGSSALYLARQAVKGGLADCALALGFEKMERGSLSRQVHRPHEPDGPPHAGAAGAARQWEEAPPAPQMFGAAGREHMERFGSEPGHYAWIGWKNHHHSINNPYAQFQTDYTAGADPGGAGDLRAADEAPVLADLRRQRGARSSPPSASSSSTTCGTGRSSSPARRWSPTCEHVRRPLLDQGRRLSTCRGPPPSAPTRRRPGSLDGRRRLRAARLLQRERADHLRGARLRRRGRGAPARAGRSDDLRRQRPARQPFRRA